MTRHRLVIASDSIHPVAIPLAPPVSLVAQMDLSSACAFDETLSDYLDSLTTGFFDALTRKDEVVASLEGEEAKVSTLLVGGAILYLAAIVFGRSWLRHILMALGTVAGACAVNYGLTASPLIKMVPLKGNELCVARVALIIGSGLLAAVTIVQSLTLGYFVVGATGGFYAAQFAIGALSMEAHKYASLAVLGASIAGGLFFIRVADSLIDTAVGLLGSFLVAQGALALLVANQDALGLALPGVAEYHATYVLAATAALFLVRHMLLNCAPDRRVGIEDGNTPLIRK